MVLLPAPRPRSPRIGFGSEIGLIGFKLARERRLRSAFLGQAARMRRRAELTERTVKATQMRGIRVAVKSMVNRRKSCRTLSGGYLSVGCGYGIGLGISYAFKVLGGAISTPTTNNLTYPGNGIVVYVGCSAVVGGAYAIGICKEVCCGTG